MKIEMVKENAKVCVEGSIDAIVHVLHSIFNVYQGDAVDALEILVWNMLWKRVE